MDFSLNQYCVYWEPFSVDGYGTIIWDDPVELSCRWESANELFVDSSGEELRSTAKVYLEDDVVVGGYLYLGELNSAFTSSDDPALTKTSYRIKRFDKIPDLSGTEFLRRAWL